MKAHLISATRVVCAFALALGFAFADTGTIRIRLEARKLIPPGEPEGFYWIILGKPAAETFANPATKANVQQLLDSAKIDPGCPAPVAFARRSVCNLFEPAEGASANFTDFLVLAPSGLAVPPPGPAPAQDFIATVEFSEIPPVPIETITIMVTTANWNDRENARLDAVDLSYPQAVQLAGLTRVPGLDPVTMLLQYSSLDLARGRRAQPFTEDQVRVALLRATIPVLHAVREKGIETGRPTPPDTVLNSFTDLLSPRLQANVNGWSDPVASVTRSDDRKTITVSIDNVRIVAFARINVDRGRIENEKGELVRFRGASPQKEREIQSDVQTAEQSLNRLFRNQLELLEGTVPDKNTIEQLLGQLALRNEIAGRPAVNGFGGNLIFGSTKMWVIGKLDAKISLNAAFTPEDIFTGEGTLTGERLLYNVFRRDLGETYALTLRGGPQVQSAEFVFGFPRSHGETWVANYGADLTASYARDLDQLIGALTRGTNGKITEGEKGLMPRAYGELRRAAQGSPWIYLVRAEVLLDWRYLLLAPDWTTARFTSGQLTAPTLRFRQGLRYDRSHERGTGFGSLSVELNGEARRSITALAGDFDFDQYLVTGSIDTFFGVRTHRDFRLRYRRGFGASSAPTPIYQLFRLGGERSLFGIEEGEYIGRGISYGRAELGVSARWLWSLVPRKPANPPPDESKKEKPPISLDQVYVTLLYDRGRVIDDSRLSRLITVDQPASGRGIAVELRGIANRANVTIGYARSAQSLAHHKGLMILGVGFDF